MCKPVGALVVGALAGLLSVLGYKYLTVIGSVTFLLSFFSLDDHRNCPIFSFVLIRSDLLIFIRNETANDKLVVIQEKNTQVKMMQLIIQYFLLHWL